MKKFIISALCVATFFLGLGAVVDKVTAKFKSDEKALALIKAARTAIGGDNAIAGVQSLRINGTSTHTFKIDGAERSENGETEIAIQLPDKLSKMVKIGKVEGDGTGEQVVNRRVETVVVNKDKDGNVTYGRGEGRGTGVGVEPGGKQVVIEKQDGSTEELRRDENGNVIIHPGDRKVAIGEADDKRFRKMEAEHAAMRQNELFRLTLGLLLSAPSGMDVNYTFGGEQNVDGTACNVIVADFGGPGVRLYLNKTSNLPVMMAYEGENAPMTVMFNKRVPEPGNGDKDTVYTFHRFEGPGTSAVYQVRFSDYRSVGGLQLPYRWTTTGGDRREEFEVSNYAVNPADISNSFQNQNQKVMLRTKKEGQ